MVRGRARPSASRACREKSLPREILAEWNCVEARSLRRGPLFSNDKRPVCRPGLFARLCARVYGQRAEMRSCDGPARGAVGVDEKPVSRYLWTWFRGRLFSREELCEDRASRSGCVVSETGRAKAGPCRRTLTTSRSPASSGLILAHGQLMAHLPSTNACDRGAMNDGEEREPWEEQFTMAVS